MTTFKDLWQEPLHEAARRSLGRVLQHMNSGQSFGVISSQRVRDDKDAGGDDHEFSPEEHNRRHAELKAEIKKAGYSYTPVQGNYRGAHERSLIVYGKHGEEGDTGLHGFLMGMGKKFAQDSIIHKPHDATTPNLHFTMDRDGNKTGDNFPLGRLRPQKEGKFGSTEVNPTSSLNGGKDHAGKTAPSKRTFVFSDGKNRQAPSASALKKPGQVSDTAVWTPKDIKPKV